MASIDLSEFEFVTATPRLVDFGDVSGVQSLQRINRLGNHYALDIDTGDVDEEPLGRILGQKLRLAKRQGALFAFPQGFKTGAPGAPVIDGDVAGGNTVPIKGLTPGYPIRFGQFFSIIHGGRRYLHACAQAVIADASGEASALVDPILRTSLSDGDVVELAKPYIEGFLRGEDDVPWALQADPSVLFGRIVIEEAE